MDSAVSISLTCKDNFDTEVMEKFLGFIKASASALELVGSDSFFSSVSCMH